MKKRMFGTMVIAIAMFVGYRAYNAQNELKMPKVTLANVEALAKGEVSIGPWYCYGDTGICHIDEYGVVFGLLCYF